MTQSYPLVVVQDFATAKCAVSATIVADWRAPALQIKEFEAALRNDRCGAALVAQKPALRRAHSDFIMTPRGSENDFQDGEDLCRELETKGFRESFEGVIEKGLIGY